MNTLSQGGMGQRDLGTLARAFGNIGQRLTAAQQRAVAAAAQSNLLSRAQLAALGRLTESVDLSRADIRAVSQAVGDQGRIAAGGLDRIRERLEARGLTGEALQSAVSRITRATYGAARDGREQAEARAERIIEALEEQGEATVAELRGLQGLLAEDPEQAAAEATALQQIAGLSRALAGESSTDSPPRTVRRRPGPARAATVYSVASPTAAATYDVAAGTPASGVRAARAFGARARSRRRQPSLTPRGTLQTPRFKTPGALQRLEEERNAAAAGRPVFALAPSPDEGRGSALSPGEVASPDSTAGHAPKELLHTHARRACKHAMDHAQMHGKRKTKPMVDALKEVHKDLERTLKYIAQL